MILQNRTLPLRRMVAAAALAVAVLLTAACGSGSGRFRMEGRLRNMNQAQFYIYSLDGTATDGIDTIAVREGRFAYECAISDTTTLVLVFPNFSEQPVFAQPGATVTIKGDATHLREITILGTDDNKLMTQLRMEMNRLMPPDIPKAAEKFVREHPESPVSTYVLQRFFLTGETVDYAKALQLAQLLARSQPAGSRAARMAAQLKSVQCPAVGKRLPAFKAVDVRGKTVSSRSLNAELNVVYAWASWSGQSTEISRRLQHLKEDYGQRLAVVGVSVDADTAACRQTVVDRDSLRWPTVCDGRLWQSPLMVTMGFADIPSCLVADKQGRIVARNLTAMELEKKIKATLGDIAQK